MFKSSMCHLYYHDLTSFLFQVDIICILYYVSLCLIMVCWFINYRYVKHATLNCMCACKYYYVQELVYGTPEQSYQQKKNHSCSYHKYLTKVNNCPHKYISVY